MIFNQKFTINKILIRSNSCLGKDLILEEDMGRRLPRPDRATGGRTSRALPTGHGRLSTPLPPGEATGLPRGPVPRDTA